MRTGAGGSSPPRSSAPSKGSGGTSERPAGGLPSRLRRIDGESSEEHEGEPMRSLITPLVLVLLVACGAEAAPPKSPASVDSAPAAAATEQPVATKPPEIKLTDTPSDKLGTAPSGFGLNASGAADPSTGARMSQLRVLGTAEGPRSIQ